MLFKEHADLTKDSFLESILNCACWKIEITDTGSEAVHLKKLSDGPAFVYTKVSTDNLHHVNSFCASGFSLITTELTFKQKIGTSSIENPCIRKAQEHDRNSVGVIAESAFSHDRFHKDKLVAKYAGNIKKAWATNYFDNKRGDMMLVYENKGEIEGFVQLLQAKDTVIIDLIAVREKSKKKGIASSLISSIRKFYPKCAEIIVGTQITNIPSISLYSKLNFQIMASSYVFHYHVI